MNIRNGLLLTAAAGCLVAGPALAGSLNQTLSGYTMYGVNRATGNLVRYDVTNNSTTIVGKVTDGSGAAMTSLDAVCYFPGFKNIYALWKSPSDGKNKLVYIDGATGKATVVKGDLEGGKFTGAAPFSSASKPYTLFAMQASKVKPPSTISGDCNINPSNSSNNEFTLTKSSGGNITRDDLQNGATVTADGTFYQGGASFLHVKPKGNGNQNGLIIDGAAYALQNANTYDFNGDMQVRVWNDKVKGNLTAMGHWWITIISGNVYVNGTAEVITPNRITTVSQIDGTVTEIMPLSQTYTGIATTDGTTFYTTNGKDLYKIDTVAQTETKVGTTPLTTPSGLEYVGTTLVAYDSSNSTLVPINPATGQSGGSSTTPPGVGSVGTPQFTPAGQDPSKSTPNCD